MRSLKGGCILAASVLLSVWLSGCGATQPSRFYLISPLPEAENGQPVQDNEHTPVLGIGPVFVPSYLDRPQMVTRSGPNRLNLAEFEKWAEPLADNIGRVLVLNLSTLLSTDRIALYPWGSTPVKYQVVLRIIRFDGKAGEDLSLVARWAILKAVGKQPLVARTSRYHEPLEDSDFTSVAATMSRAVGRLSRDIAAAMKRVVEQEQGRKERQSAAREGLPPEEPVDQE